MKKFVRFDNGDNTVSKWLWELSEPNMDMVSQLNLHQAMIQFEMHRAINEPRKDNPALQEIVDRNNAYRLQAIKTHQVDYNEAVNKYGTIYIMQHGAWGSAQPIVATCFSNDWPTENEGGKVVICENDLEAEKPWLDYLRQREETKNEKINVLNRFRTRSIADMRKHFEAATFITFYTTFTNPDWFGMLLQALDGLKGKTLLCYCIDENRLDKVFSLYSTEIAAVKANGNTFEIVTDLY